jgi:two-component system sensor histidine kinase YesM
MFLLKLRIWPQKLKYRLFAAFFFFILLPLFCLQFYSYNEIEYSISREFTLKTNEQLNLVKELMVTIMDSNFKDYLFLEKSPSIRNFLQYPEIFNSDERNSAMNGELARLKSRFPPYIQYTLADMHGDMYQTIGSANSMAYEAFVHMEEFKDLKADHFMYRWHAGEVLSLYSVLFDDNGRPYNMVTG